MERKSFTGVACTTQEPDGTFEAAFRYFTPDMVGDAFTPHALDHSIAKLKAKGRKVPVIFNHRWDSIEDHIGEVRPEDIVETADGLQVRGKFYVNEPRARKVFDQLQRKALSEWSLAFTIQKAKPRPGGGRTIEQAHLLEVGPCLAGKGETETISVKAAGDVADVEKMRRALAGIALAPYRHRIDLLSRRLRLHQIAGTR